MFPPRRILIPIDDTVLSDKALDVALSMAEQFSSQLHVLYVRRETRPATADDLERDDAEVDAERSSIHQTVTGRIGTRIGVSAERIHAEVRTGNLLACILGAADDIDADLIVMGTHGRIGFSDRVVGSTTERVLVRSPRTLLAVHEDRV